MQKEIKCAASYTLRNPIPPAPHNIRLLKQILSDIQQQHIGQSRPSSSSFSSFPRCYLIPRITNLSLEEEGDEEEECFQPPSLFLYCTSSTYVAFLLLLLL